MNDSIKCDVSKCKHNELSCSCRLSQIKVSCVNGENCTCCESYEER